MRSAAAAAAVVDKMLEPRLVGPLSVRMIVNSSLFSMI